MGADSPGPALRLVAAPLAEWPSPFLLRLREQRPITLCALEEAETGDGPVLLGYSHPAAALAQTLSAAGTAADSATAAGSTTIVTLLSDWRRTGSRMLALRRRSPERVRLVATPHLNPAAAEALLRLLEGLPPAAAPEAEGGGNREEAAAAAAAPALPGVVSHYLCQRSDIAELFADLEGQAELLGREPELQTAPPAARGLVLAERLLEEWQADRDHRLRQREEARSLSSRIEALDAQLAQARQEAEEERARLRDSEEERELIVLQLQQVQEELIRTFEETGQARQEAEELRQQLEQALQETQLAHQETHRARQQGDQARREAESRDDRLRHLERECRALFLGSRLLPGFDPTRIRTILALMREDLRL